MIQTFRQLKRAVISIVGFSVLFVGILMVVLPGPAIITIPLGLAILATEFVWARKLLASVRERFQKDKNTT